MTTPSDINQPGSLTREILQAVVCFSYSFTVLKQHSVHAAWMSLWSGLGGKSFPRQDEHFQRE